MTRGRVFALLTIFAATLGGAIASRAQSSNDNDHTLQAMRDEMARSKTRLELQIPGTPQPQRPYYVEYRLLDLDVREIVAEFGALVSSTRMRSRFMDVEARIGDYKLDSSNFISDDGFRGFIGPTGSVGIDRDYNSLRQDLWIATDQAFKEAVDTYSRKQAYLSSLARPSDIDDFSKSLRSNSLNLSSRRIGAIATGNRKHARPPPRFGHFPRFTSPASRIISSTPRSTCSRAKAPKFA